MTAKIIEAVDFQIYFGRWIGPVSLSSCGSQST